MRRFFGILISIFLLIEIYSVLPQTAPSAKDPLTATGAFHVVLSNPSRSAFEQVAAAAKLAGLDFVIVTAKDTTALRPLAGNYDGVSVFVEIESDTPSGQMVTFFSQTSASNLSDAELHRLSYLHYQGSSTVPGIFSVASHPSHVSQSWKQLDRFPEGMELANFESLWVRSWNDHKITFLTTLAIYPFNAFLSFLRLTEVYPKDSLAWDATNSMGVGHFAILGSENHTELKWPNVSRWPRDEELFRWGTNLLYLDAPLSSEFSQRQKQIYAAIKNGQSALAFPALYPLTGNSARLECQGQTYLSGARVTPGASDCHIQVKIPAAFPYPKVIRLWRNGELEKEELTQEVEISFPLGLPGTYRIEVLAQISGRFHFLLNRPVPYLLYNPFYLR